MVWYTDLIPNWHVCEMLRIDAALPKMYGVSYIKFSKSWVKKHCRPISTCTATACNFTSQETQWNYSHCSYASSKAMFFQGWLKRFLPSEILTPVVQSSLPEAMHTLFRSISNGLSWDVVIRPLIHAGWLWGSLDRIGYDWWGVWGKKLPNPAVKCVFSLNEYSSGVRCW